MSESLGASAPSLAAAASPLDAALALRARALEVMRGVLSGVDVGAPYALLDFPSYPNVGDNLIWLGTLAVLEELGFAPPAYTCDNRTFDPEALRRRVGRGLVLLRGGGNFGDLFQKHQRLREEVVAAFPGNAVVQLPQSIHFEGAGAMEQARRALSAHRRLALLVRDERSLAAAREGLGIEATLCPDLAVALGPYPRKAPAPRIVHWLTRIDTWRITVPRVFADVTGSDWPGDGLSPRRLASRCLSSWVRDGKFASLPLRDWLSRSYEPMARRRLSRALALFDAAAVLITDRLHGHVLALLTGTPHVLLDEKTGKVRSFYETWTRGTPGIAFAGGREEALATARAMLAALPAAEGSPS